MDSIKDSSSTTHAYSRFHLKEIFNTQHELALKYKEIEGMPDWPFDINSVEGQIWIKDFLWRIVEEVAEALEVIDEQDLFLEELSDALHFLVEAMIISGIESRVKFLDLELMIKDISYRHVPGGKKNLDQIRETALEMIIALGLVGNTLKNKKWKKTKVNTDYSLFEQRLYSAFHKLIQLFYLCDCNADDIYNIYHKKSNINKARQKNNY